MSGAYAPAHEPRGIAVVAHRDPARLGRSGASGRALFDAAAAPSPVPLLGVARTRWQRLFARPAATLDPRGARSVPARSRACSLLVGAPGRLVGVRRWRLARERRHRRGRARRARARRRTRPACARRSRARSRPTAGRGTCSTSRTCPAARRRWRRSARALAACGAARRRGARVRLPRVRGARDVRGAPRPDAAPRDLRPPRPLARAPARVPGRGRDRAGRGDRGDGGLPPPAPAPLGRRGRLGGIPPGAVEDFHREVAPLLAARGWLRLYRLTSGGDGDRGRVRARGRAALLLLPVRLQSRPGRRAARGSSLVGRTVEDAYARGLADYDFLRGTEPYKLEWASDRRETCTFGSARRRSAPAPRGGRATPGAARGTGAGRRAAGGCGTRCGAARRDLESARARAAREARRGGARAASPIRTTEPRGAAAAATSRRRPRARCSPPARTAPCAALPAPRQAGGARVLLLSYHRATLDFAETRARDARRRCWCRRRRCAGSSSSVARAREVVSLAEARAGARRGPARRAGPRRSRRSPSTTATRTTTPSRCRCSRALADPGHGVRRHRVHRDAAPRFPHDRLCATLRELARRGMPPERAGLPAPLQALLDRVRRSRPRGDARPAHRARCPTARWSRSPTALEARTGLRRGGPARGGRALMTWDEVRDARRGRDRRRRPHREPRRALEPAALGRGAARDRGLPRPIAARLGRPPRHFAYPNGYYTPAVRRAVREAGFEAAVTTEDRENVRRRSLRAPAQGALGEHHPRARWAGAGCVATCNLGGVFSTLGLAHPVARRPARAAPRRAEGRIGSDRPAIGRRADVTVRLALVGNWPRPYGGVAVHVARARARAARARGARRAGARHRSAAITAGDGVRPARGPLALRGRAGRGRRRRGASCHVHTNGANPKSWLVALAASRARRRRRPRAACSRVHSGLCAGLAPARPRRRRLAAAACASYGRVRGGEHGEIARGPRSRAASPRRGSRCWPPILRPSRCRPDRARGRSPPSAPRTLPLFAAALPPGRDLRRRPARCRLRGAARAPARGRAWWPSGPATRGARASAGGAGARRAPARGRARRASRRRTCSCGRPAPTATRSPSARRSRSGAAWWRAPWATAPPGACSVAGRRCAALAGAGLDAAPRAPRAARRAPGRSVRRARSRSTGALVGGAPRPDGGSPAASRAATSERAARRSGHRLLLQRLGRGPAVEDAPHAAPRPGEPRALGELAREPCARGQRRRRARAHGEEAARRRARARRGRAGPARARAALRACVRERAVRGVNGELLAAPARGRDARARDAPANLVELPAERGAGGGALGEALVVYHVVDEFSAFSDASRARRRAGAAAPRPRRPRHRLVRAARRRRSDA